MARLNFQVKSNEAPVIEESLELRDIYKLIKEKAKTLTPGQWFPVLLEDWAACVPDQARNKKPSDKSLDTFRTKLALSLGRDELLADIEVLLGDPKRIGGIGLIIQRKSEGGAK